MVKSVSLLPLGRLKLEQSLLTYRRGMVEVPMTGAFIEMADGEHMLFDTGISPDIMDNWAALPETLTHVIARFYREDDIRRHLAALGQRPEDIQIVVNSHLHWDHSGANHLFKAARFISQDREVRFAERPDPFVQRVYFPKHYDWIETMEVLSGDKAIKPGVAMLTTPGHTPGHQSMMVRLPSGKLMILTGYGEYRVRAAVRSLDQKTARQVSEEVLSLYCSGPAAGGGVRQSVTPQVWTASTLVDRDRIEPHTRAEEIAP